MRNPTRIPAVFAAFALLSLAACGPGESPPLPPQPDPLAGALFPHEVSDIEPDPAVRYGVLANGMRYAILENRTPSNVAALRLRFEVGSLMEADGQQGLAHFLEHMAFNGSENVPENEMIRILERHGLAFGADTNAYTSFSETVYMLDVPDARGEAMDAAFMLMGELDRLTLAEDAIDRERGVVLSEMRGSNTPSYRATLARFSFLFPDTLLPHRLPIGEAEVLQTADSTLFRDLYERYYTPERAFFVVAGDVDADDVEQRIAGTFGDWRDPVTPGENPELGAIGEREPEAGFFHDPAIPTIIEIYAVKPAENPLDTEAQRRANLVRGLGNSIVSRRLAALSRAENAVFLQASSSFSSLETVADIASMTVVAEPANWREALFVAENELRRARSYGFTQAELNEQIANLRTSLRNAAEQADTRQSASLANGIINAFSGDQVFSHPRGGLERFEAYADSITVEEVEAAFNAQWEGAAPLLFMTSREDMDNAPEIIMAAYAEAGAQPVEPPAGAEEAAFAYLEMGAPGEVVEREEIEDLGIVRIRFANNVMLNFKETHFENDVVYASLRFGGGLLETPGNRPELRFAGSNILSAGGTEAHSLDELQRLLAGRTVSAGFGVDTDAFSASSRTTPADLETQLQLWSGYLTEPAWRPEAISQFRQLYAISYPTMTATPAAVIQRDVGAIIRGDDPRWMFPTIETVQAIEAGDARTAMDRALSRAAIEVGMVGAITEEQAVAIVARTLGALPEREAAPERFEEARTVAFPSPAPDLVTLRHDGAPDQAAALVYWPAPDGEDAELARKLSLLSQVLQIRVIDEIREDLGAAYSPSVGSAFSREFPDFGYIGMRIEVNVDDVDDVFEVIDEIAADFTAGNISEDQLNRARQPILASIDENQEQNRYWMSVVAQAQTRPDNLERHRTQRADYEAATLDDIKALAAQYLTRESALRIQVLPQPAQ